MNHYTTSTGERFSKSQIDHKIRTAKARKIANFLDQHDHYFCEECKRSDKYPLDCSHIVSVDHCQKHGPLERAWDQSNIRLLCRECHEKHDKLNIQNLKI